MTYLLIIVFYLLFIYLSHRNIRWGIYLTLLFLPTYQIRFFILGVPATLLEGMIWLLLIVWLLKLHKEKGLTLNPFKIIKNIKSTSSKEIEKENLIPKPFRLPIVLFLVAATLSAFVSPQLQAALGIWKAYFVEALLFFIIFVYNITELKHVKQVIRILGVLTIAIGLFAIYQKLTGNLIPNPYWADEATRRVTTFFGYPNANALLIAPIILLTIGNLINDLKKSIFYIQYSIFNILVLILGTLTIIWTDSTGALIGLVMGVIFLLIFYKKTRLVTLVVLLLAIFLFIPQIQNKIQYYYISTNEIHLPEQPSDVQIRVQQWRETMNMMRDTPIFGPGLNGYQTLMTPYHVNKHLEIFLYPHNFFLNFWSETGLLGLIAIIWILIVFFWSSILGLRYVRNQKPLPCRQAGKTQDHSRLMTLHTLTLTTACTMIVLLIHGLVDVPYFKNDLSVFFWVIVGLMIVLYQVTGNKPAPLRGARPGIQDTKNIQ